LAFDGLLPSLAIVVVDRSLEIDAQQFSVSS
jgi:hypothetical protein